MVDAVVPALVGWVAAAGAARSTAGSMRLAAATRWNFDFARLVSWLMIVLQFVMILPVS
jgi:hypothetical protein